MKPSFYNRRPILNNSQHISHHNNSAAIMLLTGVAGSVESSHHAQKVVRVGFIAAGCRGGEMVASYSVKIIK